MSQFYNNQSGLQINSHIYSPSCFGQASAFFLQIKQHKYLCWQSEKLCDYSDFCCSKKKHWFSHNCGVLWSWHLIYKNMLQCTHVQITFNVIFESLQNKERTIQESLKGNLCAHCTVCTHTLSAGLWRNTNC